jgi:hypothetical protein
MPQPNRRNLVAAALGLSAGSAVAQDRQGTPMPVEGNKGASMLGPRNPGRVLRPDDGNAGFTFYMQPNIEHDTPTLRLSAAGTKIDYISVTERVVAVSGVRERRSHYGQCNFPDGPSGPIHCRELVDSKSEKRFWDPIVTRVSLSLG